MQHFLDAPVPFIMGLWRAEKTLEEEEITGCEVRQLQSSYGDWWL
jgi:hypothetical protein